MANGALPVATALASGALETIVKATQQEPPELPRLTTAQVFMTYGTMGKQIGFLVDAFKRLQDDNQQSCTADLNEILKYAEAIQKNARRLLEANR